MTPVRIQIEQIVEYIRARRAQAERDERDDRAQYGIGNQHQMRRQQRHEHQRILQPLMQPQRAEPGAPAAVTTNEHAFDIALATHATQQPRRCVSDDRMACMPPDMQVRRCVAGIVESAFAVAFAQRVALAAPTQIAYAIAAEHFVEAADVRGHGISQRLIRRGAQDAPPPACLASQPVEHALVIRQARDIHAHARRNLALQARAPVAEPDDEEKQIERIPTQQRERGFDRDIRADQRSIEIHAKRYIAILHISRSFVSATIRPHLSHGRKERAG